MASFARRRLPVTFKVWRAKGDRITEEDRTHTSQAGGMTNPEIARRLFLSPRTIQTHLSSLLAELGFRVGPVSSRSA
jgi:hypothetical protein